eukprot:COSAG02_NODE_65574_length_257_cov_1.639241_1_plen_74_part_01
MVCSYCAEYPPEAGEAVAAHKTVRTCPRVPQCASCGQRRTACIGGCTTKCQICKTVGHTKKNCPEKNSENSTII